MEFFPIRPSLRLHAVDDAPEFDSGLSENEKNLRIIIQYPPVKDNKKKALILTDQSSQGFWGKK
jgi:hypothetical protein